MWPHSGYVVGWLAGYAVLGVDLGVTNRGSTGRWVGLCRVRCGSGFGSVPQRTGRSAAAAAIDRQPSGETRGDESRLTLVARRSASSARFPFDRAPAVDDRGVAGSPDQTPARSQHFGGDTTRLSIDLGRVRLASPLLRVAVQIG